MRRFSLWLFAAILMSGISLSVQAQLSKGHFFLSFEDKNVPVENVEQLFGEWFSLPSGTEWRLTSSSTDDLGIGIEKARQIAYRAMTVYATRQTKYADFRKATLQAAKDLYGANGQEVKTVADAWDAVGVLENGVYPSAITTVRRDMQTDDRYYDLQGRPVSQPGKGIYIYKGKKLIKY